MDNIDLYIKNKNHPNLIKYPDDSLKDILKETYGIIVCSIIKKVFPKMDIIQIW